ncbi:MAG: hypothetical protein WC147_05575 [Syntrophomonas sp.]
MKIKLWPKTTSGKWAAILSIAFIILISLKIQIGIHPPTFAIASLGVAGFVAGIIAISKKDLSVLVILSILVGLVIISWTAAELFYPH